MTDLPPDSWSTSQLVEFLATLAEQSDEAGARRAAVERVLESFDAEVGVLFNRLGVATVVGLHPDDPQVPALIAVSEAGGAVHLDRVGACRAAVVDLDSTEDALRLLVARAGED